jgi:hypothetical protein
VPVEVPLYEPQVERPVPEPFSMLGEPVQRQLTRGNQRCRRLVRSALHKLHRAMYGATVVGRNSSAAV